MVTNETSMHDMIREAYLCERKIRIMRRGIVTGLLLAVGITATKMLKARR